MHALDRITRAKSGGHRARQAAGDLTDFREAYSRLKAFGSRNGMWDQFSMLGNLLEALDADELSAVLVAALADADAAGIVDAFGVAGSQGSIDFADDDNSTFEADIERLAAAKITMGCNPPANSKYCPDRRVTRGQMAAFLARALKLSNRGSVDFVDDDGSMFEAEIEMLATAGITAGCNPPTNNRFCPDAYLTRAQMAAFLARGLDLVASGFCHWLCRSWRCRFNALRQPTLPGVSSILWRQG